MSGAPIPIEVRVEVRLASLTPDDVVVELVIGPAGEDGEMERVTIVVLPFVQVTDEGNHVFEGVHVTEGSGSYSYGIRVRARTSPEHGSPMYRSVLWA